MFLQQDFGPQSAPAGATAASESRRAKQRHRRHANPFTLRGDLPPLHLDELFGREAPLALDIGCGPGEFTLALAAQRPAYNVLGVEIRAHFVERLESLARKENLANCRGLLANANLQLLGLLPPKSVGFISVNFPDPWYKKRHHKRRVLNETWLDQLERHLTDDAEVHTMTDYEPLAHAMHEALEHAPYLKPVAPGFASTSTTGLVSERERTHTARAQPIFRLAYRVKR